MQSISLSTNSRGPSWRLALILGTVAVVVFATFALTHVVYAAGTAYYINNQSGANCSNSGSGTTASAPWCDFTNVNSHTFGPGDQILLARGASWNQRMDLYGSGSAGNLITLGAYGTGALPHILRNDQPADRAIWLHDPSYWSLNDLEVSDAGAGIVVYYTTNLHDTLQFNNIYTHDIKGVFAGSPQQTDLPAMYISPGILITGNVPVTASDYAVQNVTATNLLGYHNNDDFDISGFNYNAGGQQGFLSEDLGHHSVQNVVIKNSYFHGGLAGENFDNMQHLTILDTRIDDMGHSGYPSGTTALFFWDSYDVTFVNDILTNEVNSNSVDQSGSDLEKDNDSIRFRGDYIAGNAGVGVEILQNSETNIEVSDNAFANNGAYSQNAGGTTSSLWHNNFSGALGSASGTVQNNLYAETKAFVIGDFSSFTLNNNTTINGASNLYTAANQFSSTQGQSQWRYQYFVNNTWLDILPYDSTNQRWGTNGYVSQFDTLPDTCTACWIARDWVAPSAGTINIRGRALKNDTSGGDGVQVRVTKNGAQIWPASGAPQSLAPTDQVGVTTDLDNITVATGDSIRFEVNNGGNGDPSHDIVSWAPSVAYTAGMSQGSNPTLIDDTSSSVSYSSGWSVATGLDTNTWYNGTSHYSNTTNATASYTCASCVELEWDATKSPDAGIAKVSVDGTLVTTVDLYASSRQLSRTRFGTGAFGSPGQHTLTITVSGTQNPNATASYIEIDAFQAITSAVTLDDTASGITYSGYTTYSGLDTTIWFSGTSHSSNVTGANFQYTCASCTEILWQSTKALEQGIATVFVDGSQVSQIDTYAATRQPTRVLFGTGALVAGQHTIKIVVSGTKNPSATNDYVELDALQVIS